MKGSRSDIARLPIDIMRLREAVSLSDLNLATLRRSASVGKNALVMTYREFFV